MTQDQTASLLSIVRFPVKGLTPQKLDAAPLTPDQPIPGDRRFALAHGGSAFDATAPAFQKKAHFLTWIRNPPLAALECSFDAGGTRITIAKAGRVLVQDADLAAPISRPAIEKVVLDHLGPDVTRGSVKVAEAPGAWFADVPDPYLSIQNTATLLELGRRLGNAAPLDYRRLRGNLLVDGFPAWAEMKWVGSKLQIGETVLQVEAVIGRCAATHVNPDTGVPDSDLVGLLNRDYDHNKCGVYARVIQGGTIRPGDRVGRIY
ncbi:MAG: MOSC domain-containing protein [Ferrovibrio sp.]|uniref:MOSC domain-containing protein n=1 Tax=Ferrovibrio sp. TaxID=1917215 RepID=UPI0026353792|nr:MOSC domain-containing protein [Ferrovibrio sp.]MCW0233123.1 MOSC domain-containing protein [Ferrovibrio sp.]